MKKIVKNLIEEKDYMCAHTHTHTHTIMKFEDIEEVYGSITSVEVIIFITSTTIMIFFISKLYLYHLL